MASETISLEELLQKHRESVLETLVPEEINVLITSFLPWHPSSIRAQSLLFLSKFTSDIRQKYASRSSPEAATSIIVRTFAAPTEARLTDIHEPSTLGTLSFLAAFFQVDWESASAIFLRDGLIDSVLEALELYPSSKDVSVAVANLLSQASGYQQCRPLLSSPQVISWLERSTRQISNHALRAAAAVAIVKLSEGSKADAQNSKLGDITTASPAESPLGGPGAEEDLVTLIKELVVADGAPSSSILDAVEGLAYLTIRPAVKETVSSDPILLKRLISLAPHRPLVSSFPASHVERHMEPQMRHIDLGMSYGIAVIISNLCGYKPRLSEEEKQIERLRRMTKEPAQGGKLSASTLDTSIDSDTLDDDDHVRIRGKMLMKAGVVDALTGIIKGLGGSGEEKRSITVQRSVAKSFLSLAEEKAYRGMILQGGGAKSLLTIIDASLAEIRRSSEVGQRSIDKLNPLDLLAMQALAKLSITSSPTAVFGPTQDSYVDAVRPFAILLAHTSASLLQRFEALMALTNIASVSPDAAERVSAFHFTTVKSQSSSAAVGDIVKRSESLLLDGNTMLRRAATELVCNLIGGAKSPFYYFGGAPGANAKSRLQILAVLADVDDLPTRMAASGALAIVTASPAACETLAQLEMEHHHLLPVMVDLISPEVAKEYREDRPDHEVERVAILDHSAAQDPGLVHRGVICVRNIFANLDEKVQRKTMSEQADKRGLAQALIRVIKSNSGRPANGDVMKAAADVLKWMIESGVKVSI